MKLTIAAPALGVALLPAVGVALLPAVGVALMIVFVFTGIAAAQQQGAVKPRPAASGPTLTPPAAPAAEGKNGPVIVDSDSLESMQKEGLSVFKGNVVAKQNNSVQYADRMEVYTDSQTDRIERVVSTGNVRIITRDCRMGTASRTEYYEAEQRVVLIGNARVWQGADIVTGERITLYLAEDRSLVEGGKQERVKAIFYQDRQKTEIKMGPNGPICP
ncbi:MAG TPA: lipopolysaccharide transport periplasmic protein LptA [Methylomirabilota bacterium]|nr:lipopolysaccharide transport periplasmic protein LptA [Methylomirabilota bacterium]